MSESEGQKKVSNNDLRNSQFGGGLINAENVNAGRIGGDILNIGNVFIEQKINNRVHIAIKEIPYIGVRHFVGRSQELASLHEKLYQKNSLAISAVAGMGGVGKTELAVKYAQDHEKDYSGGICWFNVRESDIAGSILTFARKYLELEVPQQDFSGRQLAPIEQVKWCWEHWHPASGLVLIVFDDVTNLENFAEYLPRNSRFRVLITTRLRNIDVNIEEISLDVLPPGEALSLLQAIIGERRVKRELATAEKFCSWLGYLPLGIELVGRYLQEDPDLSLAEILERLEDTRISDEALLIQQPNLSTAQRGVKAAFELSWKELNEKTQYIAQYISLFAPVPFAWEWVEVIEENLAQQLGLDKRDLRPAKKQLYKLHLIQRLEELDGCYKTHPLICEFLQDKLNLEIEATQIKSAFVQPFIEIARKIPNTPTREFISSISLYIPHLEEVAKNLSNVVTDEDFWSVLTGIARFYNGQGLYAIAEPWYKRCLEEVKVRLGEENLDFAISLNNLAGIYNSQGLYSEAEPLYKQALLLYKRISGEENPDFATSLNNLALVYHSQGRYAEAEPLFQQALSLRKRVLGEEHPNFALSLNNLALIYNSQGRYSEAESLFQQALSLYKRALGEKHPNFATSLNNLAYLYYLQGRYNEAEPLFQQALFLKKQVLGEEHPDFASSLNNLALVYYSQGRYSEAEPLFQQALLLRKQVLGEKHPNFALSLENLAYLYYSQGRYSEAEPLFQQALLLKKRVLGEEHPNFALSLNNLALLYNSQGRYSEAEPLFQQALLLKKRVLGEKHSSFVLSLNNLALLYSSQGRYSEAEPLFQQALLIFERTLGENHPNTVTVRNNLKSILAKKYD